MKLKSLIAAASLGAALLIAASAANATTYVGTRDVDGNTAVLDITTNGTLGRLTASDVTNFNLDVSGPVGSFTLRSSDQDYFYNNSGLLATNNDLSFLIEEDYFSITSPGGYQFYGAGGACNPEFYGESVSNYSSIYGVTDPPGTVIILGTAISPAPEPSTWALMIAGIGIVGAMMRARARRSFAAVAGA